VSGGEDLSRIYFFDESHGWVGGRSALYRTDDGGKSWGKVDINIQQPVDVVAIFFINLSKGWIALQKREADILKQQDNQFWLLQTSDGGQTWELQHEEKGATITNVSFMNEQEGWLTCERFVGLGPFRFVHLVFHTIDGGKHWVDVSQNLNYIAQNDQGIVNDVISDIKPDGPLSVTVLTGSGKIFKTEDGGQKWQQIGAVEDSWGWPWYERFGYKESGLLWVAGSVNSSRGMWGMILVAQKGIWTKYKLNEFYFADALFTSDHQVLACGSSLSDEGSGADSDQSHGIILYSSDSGYNWSIIYRNPQVKSVEALAAIDSDHVLAVGDGGIVVRLETTEK
jgi:photosystem II stability/assembly factor-like uncharacterized protein